jgi:hypothetical protein
LPPEIEPRSADISAVVQGTFHSVVLGIKCAALDNPLGGEPAVLLRPVRPDPGKESARQLDDLLLRLGREFAFQTWRGQGGNVG